MKRLLLVLLIFMAIAVSRLYQGDAAPKPRSAARKVASEDIGPRLQGGVSPPKASPARKVAPEDIEPCTRSRIGEPEEVWGVVHVPGDKRGTPPGVSWYARDKQGKTYHFFLYADGRCTWGAE